MTLIVRRLTAAEGEAFRSIRLEALTVAADNFGTALEDELKKGDNHFADQLKTLPVWVAVDGDTIVGMVTFTRATNVRQAHKGVLGAMYVAPSARGSGAADALISAVLDHARAEGVEQVLLTCNANNARAIRVYERHGFKLWGVESRALKAGDAYFDDAHMVRPL